MLISCILFGCANGDRGDEGDTGDDISEISITPPTTEPTTPKGDGGDGGSQEDPKPTEPESDGENQETTKEDKIDTIYFENVDLCFSSGYNLVSSLSLLENPYSFIQKFGDIKFDCKLPVVFDCDIFLKQLNQFLKSIKCEDLKEDLNNAAENISYLVTKDVIAFEKKSFFGKKISMGHNHKVIFSEKKSNFKFEKIDSKK